MFGRKQKPKEPLPWYRAKNYKGSLTEQEKRELDAFRHRETQGGRHPAATYSDLPNEVQMYISKIEVERYNHIQDRLVGSTFVVSAIGAFLLVNHFGWINPDYHSDWALAYGALLLVAPWIYYPIKWRKNADTEILLTDENIREEWEFEYIVDKRHPDE